MLFVGGAICAWNESFLRNILDLTVDRQTWEDCFHVSIVRRVGDESRRGTNENNRLDGGDK